ncbi:HAMP domain-containing sensor histidine kinase [Polaromonas sp. SM01]|uniref:sensor histidine kinase n=1 Tax=Polaromonas sp. SM01 TaxID=3085630 RepID=UPI00298253E8|nr:HAMP domain-containing sensor histidine kinase [Polaromonas sp. SM01]MDW5441992.1 HAMP domain-containing sensor histidine kinase [Polaromonas sp. SM01]
MNTHPVQSIQRRVLVWAMGALALGASLLIASSYLTLIREMDEVFEDNLKQVALAVANHHGTYGMTRIPRIADQLPKVYEEYGKFEFVTAAWTRNGTLLHSSAPVIPLPFRSRSGLSRVKIGTESWHLYTIVLEDGIVQAAQRDSERQALARETSSTLILPALGMLLLLAALLTFALRRGLAPLALAANEITERSARALHPIALTAHPPELHLLIGAINDLMARLGAALLLQQHLLADAAHELRTPVTALRLQLQLLERAGDEPQREAALAELRTGIDRAQHLIEQLLQLSRLAPETPALHREPVDLAGLARSSVSRFSARADAKNIDLGAVAEGMPAVAADAQQLTILLDNLVDNALRHTPVGGRVDVGASLENGLSCLTVTDTGPGIAASERPWVFERFYRGQNSRHADHTDHTTPHGSGLGLAIVHAVAERHGAVIQLEDGPGGIGLRVTVRFPAP